MFPYVYGTFLYLVVGAVAAHLSYGLENFGKYLAVVLLWPFFGLILIITRFFDVVTDILSSK